MMKKKLGDKLEFLEIEIEQLKSCSSENAFFQRLATYSLPKFREIYVDKIEEWENKIRADDKTSIAAEELSEAFFSLWNYASKAKNLRLKRQLITIIQRVRGPRFDFVFGKNLFQIIYPLVRDLYNRNLGISQKYFFGVSCLKTYELSKAEFRRKMIENLPVFSYQFKKAYSFKKKLKDLLKLKIKKNKIQRKKEHHFFVINIELDLWELNSNFAPNAKNIYVANYEKFKIDEESNPHLTWLNFIILEKSWSFQNINLFETRFSKRLRGDSEQIWRSALDLYEKFHHIRNAGKLKNCPDAYFNKANFLAHLSRLMAWTKLEEITGNYEGSILEIHEECSIKSNDEGRFCSWYGPWLKKNDNKYAHSKTVKHAIKDFKKSEITLSKEYEDSTYKEWIRRLKKRKKISQKSQFIKKK